jgi:hypothetical protein
MPPLQASPRGSPHHTEWTPIVTSASSYAARLAYVTPARDVVFRRSRASHLDLLDSVKDNVPHLARHDIIADDVLHLHPMRLPLGDRSVIVEFFGYGLQVQCVAALVYDADNKLLPLEIVELPFGRVLVINPGASCDLLAQTRKGDPKAAPWMSRIPTSPGRRNCLRDATSPSWLYSEGRLCSIRRSGVAWRQRTSPANPGIRAGALVPRQSAVV